MSEETNPQFKGGERRYEFKDPTTLFNWTRGLALAGAATCAVGFVTGLNELDLLISIRDQTFGDLLQLQADAEASDRMQMVVGWTQFAVLMSAFVTFLFWVYRSNNNAHSFGARTCSSRQAGRWVGISSRS